ncbi:MAG: LysM peptidoglycan-binding domain-containing protein [Anaerolineae bacterium]|nr:LysM peptidoglycan-binding domain-containing protein [Anaerolineae bacterium]
MMRSGIVGNVMNMIKKYIYWGLGIVLGAILVACADVPVVEVTPTMMALATETGIAIHTPVATPVVIPTEGAWVADVGGESLSVPVEEAVVQPPPADIEYIVQPGDTLVGIAIQYNVPLAAIQLHNEMGASIMIQVGQVLFVPPALAWEEASLFWAIYEVQEGDTLSGIAADYDLDLAQLTAVNGMASADYLSIGQPLILPVEMPVELARVPDPTSVPLPTQAPPVGVMAATAATLEPTSIPVVELPTPASVPAEIAAWPGEVWRLMNEVRAVYGLPPYAYNETLALAAQLHADDCLQRGFCNHTGSDGSNIKTRVLRVGYAAATWAECWAMRQSPLGAIDIWMDEVPPNDPHRRTLLSEYLTEVGIGVGMTDRGYAYFIADFGRPQ